MAYRNGTYVAFHAQGTSDPTASDIKYYRTLLMWNKGSATEFKIIDSHEKNASVRDTSKRETLARRLRERLNSSRNMLLIVTDTTKNDCDWVPFEITYAIDQCKIPIIAAYPGYPCISAPAQLRSLWPTPLRERIDNQTANVIHIPFKQMPIAAAIGQFDHNAYPNNGGLGFYNDDAYRSWGLK